MHRRAARGARARVCARQLRVEAAYRRSDLFDRRRVLMADWTAYIA